MQIHLSVDSPSLVMSCFSLPGTKGNTFTREIKALLLGE